MWQTFLETAGAFVAQLTPDTPTALWIPYAGYAATTLAALIIAVTVRNTMGSRLAAGAAVIGYVLTPATVDSGYGPLLAALALFGVFFAPDSRSRRVTSLLIVAGIFLSGAIRIFMWILVGFGLALLAEHAGAARGRKGPFMRVSAVAVLTIIMITARIPAAATSAPALPKPLGHERMTLIKMRALLSNIPSGSALVREERNTDILFRAAARDFERSRVDISHVENDAVAIRATLKTKRVFALPHAQQALSMQGFKIVDGLRVADRGLAEITLGADCVVATHRWQDAPQLAGHTSLAFVAADDDQKGPVVLLLSGQEQFIRVNAVGWEPRTLRGFSPRSFDLHGSEDRRDFFQASEGDPQLPSTSATSNMLTRVAMWRMPDAPRFMRVDLSLPAPMVVAYLSQEAKEPATVCPVFPAPVFPIR